MAPRKGNTRMDAALSAMSQFGFDRKVVQATVKELLKVYAVGVKGWTFIEGDSYAVLTEAILEKQKPISVKGDAALKEDAPRDDGCPHDDATCGENITETSVAGPSSTVLQSSFSNAEATDCASQTTVPDAMDSLPVDSVAPRRRRPSYGWIGSDDEEEPVELPLELTMDRLKELAKLLIRPVETKKRKTRWDVRPDDI